MFRVCWFAMVAAALCADAAMACDVCGTHVPLPTPGSKAAWQVSVFEQVSNYNPPSEGGHDLESATTQLGLGWRLNGRWSLQLSVPFHDRTLDDTSESGVGDLSLFAVCRVLQRETGSGRVLLDLYGGIKAPTGDSGLLKEDREAVAAGEEAEHGHEEAGMEAEAGPVHAHAHGHHLALGSGSWDGLVGARGAAYAGRWLALADVQYVATTEGDYAFTYGDELTWRAGLQFAVVERAESALRVGVDLTGEWRGDDKVLGEMQDGSGTAGTYLGPVIAGTWRGTLSLFAAIDLPVGHADRGIEGAAEERVRAGASWQF